MFPMKTEPEKLSLGQCKSHMTIYMIINHTDLNIKLERYKIKQREKGILENFAQLHNIMIWGSCSDIKGLCCLHLSNLLSTVGASSFLVSGFFSLLPPLGPCENKAQKTCKSAYLGEN